MNPHFTLFREAMARPGTSERHGSANGAAVAALVIGLIMAAAVIYPMISG